ncbi:MAG: DUF6340 family protein [Saprospiraceae bacterium]
MTFSKFLKLIIPVLLYLIVACKPVATIQVLQPAQIIIPEHIQKILLVDRSKPSGGWFSNLEGLFSGEEYQQDQQGRRMAMEALVNSLSKTPRFQIINPGLEFEGSRGGRSMMAPMNGWDVEELCKKYEADALLAIEMFDSDIQTGTSPRTVKEKDKTGKEISKIVYDGKRNGRVNLGWRIYDPSTKSIIEEYKDSDTNEKSSSAADTQQNAVNNLQRSNEMVRGIAQKLGSKYGARIAPIYIQVARSYFKTVKGRNKDKFEEAARYADTKEWLRANAIWEKIAAQGSDKEAAGKATYNMAVAAEVNGLLSQALQLAKDAYTQYGLKNAKSYIRTLEQRLADQELIERQMHEQKKS